MAHSDQIQPSLWPNEQLISALYGMAELMMADNAPIPAKLVRAAAVRLYRYAEYEKRREPAMPSTVILPSDFGTGERMMKWLNYEHLAPELQGLVKHFNILGTIICDTIPAGPERTVALRKLVESKDCAVRAVIEGMEPKKD